LVTGPDATERPRILVVGYNAFDVVVPVRDYPSADEKCEVPGMFLGGGGPGATAALALARLGAAVKFITPLTDDLPGQLQRQELLAAGVDLSLCPTITGCESPKAVILVEEAKGLRTIFWSRGDVPTLGSYHANSESLDEVDLLYTDGHEAEVSLQLARVARARGLPVVMDAGSVRGGSAELVASCTDVVSSRGFAPELTGCPDPVEALLALRDMGPERVAMTFGVDGALGLVNNRPLPVPAFDVPVRDTTGAGDAFHAGYAFARANGLDFRACLDWGSAVAGLKCRDWGGRRGLPLLREVLDLLASGRRKPPSALGSA
jgi:ribokinase